MPIYVGDRLVCRFGWKLVNYKNWTEIHGQQNTKEYIFSISSYSYKHEVTLSSIWKFSLYLTEIKPAFIAKINQSIFLIKPEAYLFQRDTNPLNKYNFCANFTVLQL
jgi:hypothetical protein